MRLYVAIFRLHEILTCVQLLQSTSGPSYTDEDYAAAAVLNEYLSTMEGPFWKGIRGAGLAYGSSVSLNAEESVVCVAGCLVLTFYPSLN